MYVQNGNKQQERKVKFSSLLPRSGHTHLSLDVNCGIPEGNMSKFCPEKTGESHRAYV